MFGSIHGAHLDNKSLDKYNFFEKVTSCGRKCSKCNYCDELARNLIVFGVVTPEGLEDMGLKMGG